MSDHPVGQFEAEVVDHGIVKAGTGTSQLAVKFETAEGTITGWFPMTEKAIKYTIEKAVNMGFTGSSLAELNDGTCLVGNRCVITVAEEEYKGEMKLRVRFVNPVGWKGFEIERDDAAAANVRQFDALLHKMAPAKATAGAEELPGDDIPF